MSNTPEGLLHPGRLLKRIGSTLAFLRANLSYLEDAPAGDSRADKASCELLLLCEALHPLRTRLGTDELGALNATLGVAAARMRGPAVLHGLVWRPARVAMLSMGSGLLSRMGYPAPGLEGAIRHAWASGFYSSLELSPFQRMELSWSAKLHQIDVDARQPTSLLDDRPSPLMMSPEDAYAYTHAVFFATDFGNARPPGIDHAAAAAVIDSGILWSVARADYDLLGEFLLSAHFLGLPPSNASVLGTATLLCAWDEYGFVPERILPLPLPGPDRPRELFFLLYHANLVAACLVANHLRTPWPFHPAGSNHEDPPGLDVITEVHGAPVARRVATNVSASTLTPLAPALRIALGFVRCDDEQVRNGLEAARRLGVRCWTVESAERWMEMIARIEAGAQGRRGEPGEPVDALAPTESTLDNNVRIT